MAEPLLGCFNIHYCLFSPFWPLQCGVGVRALGSFVETCLGSIERNLALDQERV